MNTPLSDFIERYAASGVARLHVPGHKGAGTLIESLDITEVAGADALYEARGVIAESERGASSLFGSGRTLFGTEGSSQCVRAMLFLAKTGRREETANTVLAGRNAHRAFIDAAALCDFDVRWIWPEGRTDSPCACDITPSGLGAALDAMPEPPFCVYVTSPDYLGNMLDIAGLGRVCSGRGVPLLVDNAHGAYLRFLPGGRHPMDCGADMCCDSAHKTLPVLTGGAYLHIGKGAPSCFADGAKRAMALFGSTSPSYLILRSLDRCSAALSGGWPGRLRACVSRLDGLKDRLRERGFVLTGDEPLKLTLRCGGFETAGRLRAAGVECEYVDAGYVVMMFSPDNGPEDFRRVDRALEKPIPREEAPWTPPRLPRAMSIRRAMFSPSETVPVAEAEGRVCAAPTASCPPAVPVAVSGEVITSEAVESLLRFGFSEIAVVTARKPSYYDLI